MSEQKNTKEFIEVRGIVEELLPAAKFKILLENGQIIIGHLAGKMRLHRIRVLMGDQVEMVLDPYGGRARIVRRLT